MTATTEAERVNPQTTASGESAGSQRRPRFRVGSPTAPLGAAVPAMAPHQAELFLAGYHRAEHRPAAPW